MTWPVPLAALLALTPFCAAQIVDANGRPNANYATLWGWYDASNGVNSSPTPLPDGTAVTNWDDLSSYGRHLTRLASDPNRHPTVRDDIDSCGAAVRFDGDDFIWGAVPDIGRCSGPRTIFVVVKANIADRRYVFDGTTNSGRTTLHLGETATPDTYHVFWGDSSQGAPNGFLMNGTPVQLDRYGMHTVVIGATQQEHYVNITLSSSANEALQFNMGGLILGARVNTTLGLDGYIKEVLVYEEELNAGDRGLIWSYLLNRHPFSYTENYGTGCSGTGGLVPQLDVQGCPERGASIAIRLSDALPNTPVAINFGTQRLNLSFGPCTLLTDSIVAAAATTDANGQLVIPVTIPASVNAVAVPTQALVLDPGVPPLNLAATNGAAINIF